MSRKTFSTRKPSAWEQRRRAGAAGTGFGDRPALQLAGCVASGKSPDRSEPQVLIWEGNDSLPREAPLVSGELKSRRARHSAWHVVGIDERWRLLINMGTNGAIFERVSPSLRGMQRARQRHLVVALLCRIPAQSR